MARRSGTTTSATEEWSRFPGRRSTEVLDHRGQGAARRRDVPGACASYCDPVHFLRQRGELRVERAALAGEVDVDVLAVLRHLLAQHVAQLLHRLEGRGGRRLR